MLVLDHGSVDLISFMGGDQRVDQAAGVSLGRFERSRGDEQVAKIIKYMMKHRHGTPFEHSVFTFHVKAPIFVVREWMRHRVGSYNEISGRYAELPFVVYEPLARSPIEGNRQGSESNPNLNDLVNTQVRKASITSYDAYITMLEGGIAKEVARTVLPLNLYTEFVWTVNARSLMNFLSLRLGEDAQEEIRHYAVALLQLFNQEMPLTCEAFIENGYTAP